MSTNPLPTERLPHIRMRTASDNVPGSFRDACAALNVSRIRMLGHDVHRYAQKIGERHGRCQRCGSCSDQDGVHLRIASIKSLMSNGLVSTAQTPIASNFLTSPGKAVTTTIVESNDGAEHRTSSRMASPERPGSIMSNTTASYGSRWILRSASAPSETSSVTQFYR